MVNTGLFVFLATEMSPEVPGYVGYPDTECGWTALVGYTDNAIDCAAKASSHSDCLNAGEWISWNHFNKICRCANTADRSCDDYRNPNKEVDSYKRISDDSVSTSTTIETTKESNEFTHYKSENELFAFFVV